MVLYISFLSEDDVWMLKGEEKVDWILNCLSTNLQLPISQDRTLRKYKQRVNERWCWGKDMLNRIPWFQASTMKLDIHRYLDCKYIDFLQEHIDKSLDWKFHEYQKLVLSKMGACYLSESGKRWLKRRLPSWGNDAEVSIGRKLVWVVPVYTYVATLNVYECL